MRSKALVILAIALVGFLGGRSQNATASTVAALNPNDPMSWLVKSVCTDAQNQVLAVDPYGGCPAGAGIRKIQSGDPLPYHNIEQGGYQQRDAFPVVNPSDSKTWIIATFDYQPFNSFNLTNGTDGYDVVALQNGWAAGVNTSDGGGYGQTFFGSNCTVGGAWVLFPTSGFLSGGQSTVPIADVYWEQSGQSYPGACPSRYSTSTLTSWKYQAGFQFGGINGHPTKTMDTVISYHGFQSGFGFLFSGHLEVFYFTKEYGITRWEVWTSIYQNPSPTTECVTPSRQTYHNVTFVVQACHDWSNVTPASTADIPVWPIPNINLLQKPHFDGDITTAWSAAGSSSAGKPLYWSVANSAAPRDTAASKTGVRYLITSCDAGGGQCNPSAFAEAMYQDIPATKFVSGSTYGFGINVRTEPNPSSGTIAVGIEQLDESGKPLSAPTVITATIGWDNGTPGLESQDEGKSVYLSTASVYTTTTINLVPSAAKVRFLISPQTPQTFDVLDAWLAPWPVPPNPLGTP
jgi:hypothetical protein